MSPEPASTNPAAPADLATVARRLAAPFVKLVAGLALVAVVYALRTTEAGPAEVFLWRQDLPVLAAILIAVIAMRWLPAWRTAPAFDRPRAAVAGIAVLSVLIAGLAGPLLFGGYTLSLDEFMADFDAAIFGRGDLMAVIPDQWRAFAPALAPLYTLQTADHSHWAAAYLPLNAAFRAGAGAIGAAGWMNPVWAGLSIVALYGIGRRLWPSGTGPALAATVLLATSAQFLIMAMTSYAMPPHLALNLVWLWLFLRGGKWGNAGAILVAFIACGLHQVIFHPMFAAPFVAELWFARRWGRASFFTLAYAAIGLFWIAYWGLLYRHVGVSAAEAQGVGGAWFVERVLALFANFKPSGLGAVAEGLVRFVTWQNLLAVPLALVGVARTFRLPGPARPLALGIVLTIAAMWVLVPDQTHGWGYRYLHGFLGSICLLAVYGGLWLTSALARPDRDKALGIFGLVALVCLAVLLPLRAWQAHAFTHPYARYHAAVRASSADVAIVDNGWKGFDIGAVVRNDPYLAQRPRIMLLNSLDETAIRSLCAGHSVEVFDARHPAAAGMLTFTAPWAAEAKAKRDLMASLGCGS